MEEYRGSTSYYSTLGLSPSCSSHEIRRAYRKLAMQWHPDRWTKTPSLLGEAKRKFQQIQEAYEVLSDQRKRTLYDAGLYDHDDEYDEGFSDFVQEMFSLMTQVRPEEKNCTMEDLQKMFVEMAEDFDLSLRPCESSVFNERSRHSPFNEPSRHSPFKRMRWDSNLKTTNPHFGVPEFAMYGVGGCCN